MKKMMMALAALCVAGAASAVTYDWTQIASGTGIAGQRAIEGVPSLTGTGALKITMTLDANATFTNNNTILCLAVGSTAGTANGNPRQTAYDRLFVNASGTDGTVQIRRDSFANNDGGINVGNNSGDVKFVAGQENTFEIFWTPTGTEGELKMTFKLNGTEIATYTGGYLVYEGGSDAFNTIAIGESFGGADGVSAVGEWTVEWAPVPEPTALALLALGVAGLALRRKAA